MTAGPARACPAGHQLDPRKPGRNCPGCRRDTVVARVAAADRSLTAGQVAEAVERGCRSRRGAAEPGGGAGSWRGRRCARPRCAAGSGSPGHRADRRRVRGAHGSGVHDLRAHRAAADPVRAGRSLPAVPQPAARDRLHPMRRGPAGRRADQRRRAGLRAVPPPRARSPPLRDLRQDRPDRRPGPRRRHGRVRELLPDAHGGLHGLPATLGMQLRGHPADLPDLLAAVHGRVRPLRAGPAASRPLGRGTGLRHLLYGHPAPARPLRGLRPATAAGLPARTGRRHLRRLRRTDRHPCVRAVRRRGQAVREGPMRPLQLAAANRRPDPGPGRAGHAGTGNMKLARQRGHHGRRTPYSALNWLRTGAAAAVLADVAARPHSPHPPGAG